MKKTIFLFNNHSWSYIMVTETYIGNEKYISKHNSEIIEIEVLESKKEY